jgi:hypothetical protein
LKTGGSHDTGKFIVIVFGNDASSKPRTNDEPENTGAIKLRYEPLKLHVDFGGIGVRTDINVSVRIFQEKIVDATSTPTTRLLLEWEAATMPALFPLMKGAFRTR